MPLSLFVTGNPFVRTPTIIEDIAAQALEFPLRGEWQAINTPAYRIPSHGTDYLAQRYAYDFVQIDARGNPICESHMWRYFLTKPSVEIVHGWDASVHAPATGRIVDAADGWPDRRKLNFFVDYFSTFVFPPRLSGRDLRVLAGNYVTIETDAGYVLLAHLQNGALSVRVGQLVFSGDVIGFVGNSGNTMIPHLHIQMMDGSDPLQAKPLPCYFVGIEEWNGSAWRPTTDGVPQRLQRIRFGVASMIL
jgi:hypothetical protein